MSSVTESKTSDKENESERDVHASNPWIALGLLCAAFFMTGVDISIVQVTLPTIQDTLGFSEVGLQWVTTIYVLMYGGFMLLGGRAADLYGRRRLFLSGVGLFGVGSAAAGGASTSMLLLGGRALQGLGAALIIPAAISIITSVFPSGSKRNRALGIYSAFGGGGFSLGLVIGGLITTYLGWRWIFFLNLPVAVAVFALTPLFVPSSRAADGTRFDGRGAVTLTGGLLTGVYAMTEVTSLGWTDPHIIGVGVASALLLIGFVIHENQTREPLIPLSIFGLRSMDVSIFVSGALATANITVLFFGTQYFQSIQGQTAFLTGLAFLPLGVLTVVASTVLAGRLVSRYGLRPILAVGMGFVVVGAGYLSMLSIGGSYWLAFLPGIGLIAIGYGLTYPSVAIGAVSDVNSTQHGLASGLQQTSYQLGNGIGLALSVTVAAALTSFGGEGASGGSAAFMSGFNAAMATTAVVAGVAGLAALTLRSGIGTESTAEKTAQDDQRVGPSTTD